MVRTEYMHFDGIDDRVTRAHTPSLAITQGISLEIWVRSQGHKDMPNPAEPIYIIHKQTRDWAIRTVRLTGGTPGRLFFYVKIAGTARAFYYDNPDRLWDNQWHHIACTYDQVTGRIYVDGDLVMENATWAGLMTNTGNVLEVGRYSAGAGDYFKGDLASVRVYNRAMSDEEVAYNRRHPNSPKRWGLVLDWNQESIDGAGGTWDDRSGNVNDGTIVGAVESELPIMKPIYPYLHFDGIDDYCRIPSSVSLDAAWASFTMEVWVRSVDCKAPRANRMYILHKDTSRYAFRVTEVGANVGCVSAIYSIGGVTRTVLYLPPMGSSMWDGKWHQILSTFDGTNIDLYVDGVGPVATGGPWVGALTGGGADLYVGSQTAAFRCWPGDIALVNLYGKALTLAEIQYNYRHPNRPKRDGLILGFTQESLIGDEWKDSSFNTNDGARFGVEYVKSDRLPGVTV